MWPFTSNKQTKKEPKRNTTREAIETLRSFRDIGQTFYYRGIEMIVEELWDIDFNIGYIPRIAAAYKNNLGEIKYLYFYCRHLPALIAENKSNKAVHVDQNDCG